MAETTPTPDATHLTQRPADASLDTSFAGPVGTSLVIAAEPRTGSTLLTRGLWATGRAGRPAEYLLPHVLDKLRRRWGDPRPTPRGRLGRWRRVRRGEADIYLRFSRRSFARFLNRLAHERATPNGVFAIKLMWNHLETFHFYRLDPSDFPGRTIWVRQRRHDVVAQAVSRARAMGSGRYHSFQPEGRPVTYDRAAIQGALDEVAVARTSWDAYLRERRIDYLDVWYEDLVADFAGTLAAVLDHAGIDHPPAWPEPPLERLADDLTQDWIERFRSGR